MHHISLFLLPLALAAQGESNQSWKAGVAKVKITPTVPMWMSGYAARTRPAEGMLHDLWAKALVLQDARGEKAALVSLDLVGIDRELSLAIRKDIEKRDGFSLAGIMLACSHTHSGPVIRGNLDTMYFLDETQQRYRREYTIALHKQIVDVVHRAVLDLQPAQLTRALGQASFAVNRRNNPEAKVPDLIRQGKLRGPFDHDVPVLIVRDVSDKVRALAVGYACHATTLDAYDWSGDYPGFAMDELEDRYPGATALFWAGCGADQNPIPRRSVSLARDYGRQLADAVQVAMRRPAIPIKSTLKTTYSEIELPLAQLPSREQLVADTTNSNRYVASRAKHLLEQVAKRGSLPASYPYPIQAWMLGENLLWFGLGGEVVVDFALRLKLEAGEQTTWVAGYCNDVMAYIPSLRVLKEGGYEGGGAMLYYGMPGVWSPDVEERIVTNSLRMASRVGLARP